MLKLGLLVSSLLALTDCAVIQRQNSESSSQPLHFFVFGDSYTASGFNISGEQPSSSQPFGNPSLGPSPDDVLDNPDIANKSSANGPIWAQYLTTNHNTTLTLTYDFAISGASIPDGFTDEILNEYEPMYASMYSNGSDNNASSSVHTMNNMWTSNSSIFASFIGINDINWCSTLFAKNQSETYYQSCLPPRMDEYFALMTNLYVTGARNFFFVNMPPLQRAPMVFEHGEDTISNYKAAVEYFNNELLPAYVSNFTTENADVRAIVYDAHSFFNKILDNPTWYGFKDNQCYACIGCNNGTECFWANNYHPNTQVHQRMAADMVTNLTAVGWPEPNPLRA